MEIMSWSPGDNGRTLNKIRPQDASFTDPFAPDPAETMAAAASSGVLPAFPYNIQPVAPAPVEPEPVPVVPEPVPAPTPAPVEYVAKKPWWR